MNSAPDYVTSNTERLINGVGRGYDTGDSFSSSDLSGVKLERSSNLIAMSNTQLSNLVEKKKGQADLRGQISQPIPFQVSLSPTLPPLPQIDVPRQCTEQINNPLFPHQLYKMPSSNGSSPYLSIAKMS